MQGLRVIGLWCLTFFGNVNAQQGSPYQSKNCDKLGGFNVVVNLDQILDLRIPELPKGKFSQQCSLAGAKLTSDWRHADEGNAERLDNKLCSYRMGWIEKVPGTCTAGGPPPICPANHWIHVGPERAMSAMAAQEASVLEPRRDELAKAVCSCKLSEYRNSNVETSPRSGEVKTRKLNPEIPRISVPVISCQYGCPPGMDCIENVCRAPSEQQANIRRLTENPITESVLDQGAEATVSTSIKTSKLAAMSAIKLALEIIESFPVRTARTMYDVAAPTTLGTDKQLYEHIAVETTRHLQEFKQLDDELISLRAHRPSRGPDAIAMNKKRLQALLRDDIEHLNLAFIGVKNSPELGPYECPDVLQLRQNMLNQAIVNAISM